MDYNSFRINGIFMLYEPIYLYIIPCACLMYFNYYFSLQVKNKPREGATLRAFITEPPVVMNNNSTRFSGLFFFMDLLYKRPDVDVNSASVMSPIVSSRHLYCQRQHYVAYETLAKIHVKDISIDGADS
jgi:hypothetical protein